MVDPEPLRLATPASDSVGIVRSMEGTTAQLVLQAGAVAPALGTMLTIDTGFALAVAQVTGMHKPNVSGPEDDHPGLIDIELVGELPRTTDGATPVFRRGVSVAPRLGDGAAPINREVLAAISSHDNPNSVKLGYLHQDRSVPAFVETNEMLGKHFAVVGSTGTGKSCTVALILRQVLARHPQAHIVMLDPHDEYKSCFGEQVEHIPLDQLNLPFWSLTFEEFTEIVLGGSSNKSEETELLREFIPAAKRKFALSRTEGSAVRLSTGRGNGERYSVDVPIPYRMADVMTLIDEEMGKLERPRDLDVYRRLKSRLQNVSHDPRFAFMFGSFAAHDSLKSMLKRIFRVPVQGKPITLLSLMGLPSEIINVLVSVLARLAFDLAIYSKGRVPITFVCEEAHRYVPAQNSQGFEPTKRSIARIAKEGRKYGASLCIVSQRPADLDATILSQCSTVFAMRLTNEHDQAIVSSAMADASRPLLRSLPLLGTGEAIVFGEAVNLPSRIVLDQLPAHAMPNGGATVISEEWSRASDGDGVLDTIIGQWRTSTAGNGQRMMDAVERLHEQRDEQAEALGVTPLPQDRPPGYGISYSGRSADPALAGPDPFASGPMHAHPAALVNAPRPAPAPDRRAVRSLPRNSGFASKWKP